MKQQTVHLSGSLTGNGTVGNHSFSLNTFHLPDIQPLFKDRIQLIQLIVRSLDTRFALDTMCELHNDRFNDRHISS